MPDNITPAASAKPTPPAPPVEQETPITAPPEAELTLPMPCHFAYGKKWHKGTIVQFVVTPLGCQAIVKPSATRRLTLVDLAHLEEGHTAPASEPMA